MKRRTCNNYSVMVGKNGSLLFVVCYWFFMPSVCSVDLPFRQRLRTFGAFVPGILNKHLPSSCTAFSQVFTVNRFRWLIRDERPGKGLIASLGRRDPKRFDHDEIQQRPRNQAGQTLCFPYTNAWDQLGCLRWANEVIRPELDSANVWIIWGKMWRKLYKLYFLPNVKPDYVKKLAPFCFIWNDWSYVLVGSSFRDSQISFFKYKNSALILFVLSTCFIAFIVQWKNKYNIRITGTTTKP